MIHQILKDKPTKLFIVFASFFVANAVIAECIGGKIFSLEKIFGLQPANLTIFGHSGLSFNFTCGVLLWPFEFIMTDIVNEYYGPKAVKRISYIAIGLISYAFLMFFLTIHIPSADFWIGSKKDEGVPDMESAFTGIFGQGLWIIVGSLVAFGVSQFVDVVVFQQIKKITGNKWIWMRATGSTLVSQLIDSYIVLIIAFKIGNNWEWGQVLAIGVLNYTYKFVIAIVLTPLIIFAEKRIEKYLGHNLAHKMKRAAMGEETDGFSNIPAAG
jgi:uncharacterized integral membrane protein (TIGR00697 family)